MKRSRIKPYSDKRKAELDRYHQTVRPEYLFLHPDCEIIGCARPATDIHHRKGRSGPLLNDTEFFMAVDRTHHEWIENNPIEAKEKGYSLSRLSNG